MVTQDLHPHNSQDNLPLPANVWSFVSELLSSVWALSLKALLFPEDGMSPKISRNMLRKVFVNWEKTSK